MLEKKWCRKRDSNSRPHHYGSAPRRRETTSAGRPLPLGRFGSRPCENSGTLSHGPISFAFSSPETVQRRKNYGNLRSAQPVGKFCGVLRRPRSNFPIRHALVARKLGPGLDRPFRGQKPGGSGILIFRSSLHGAHVSGDGSRCSSGSGNDERGADSERSNSARLSCWNSLPSLRTSLRFLEAPRMAWSNLGRCRPAPPCWR
jgi:hypothetical protein